MVFAEGVHGQISTEDGLVEFHRLAGVVLEAQVGV
jgi:hypothetical protein